jgi:hypothetical protein
LLHGEKKGGWVRGERRGAGGGGRGTARQLTRQVEGVQGCMQLDRGVGRVLLAPKPQQAASGQHKLGRAEAGPNREGGTQLPRQ